MRKPKPSAPKGARPTNLYLGPDAAAELERRASDWADRNGIVTCGKGARSAYLRRVLACPEPEGIDGKAS